MTIDHASREPDDPSGPSDPPPIGACGDAARNLFAPRAGVREVPPGPPGYDMRRLTWAAVIIHGGQKSGRFTSGAFALAVREAFDLREPPDAAWCRAVLRKLDHITTYPGGDHHRIQTG